MQVDGRDASARGEQWLRVAKGVVIATWAYSILSFLPPLDATPAGMVGQYVFWILAFTHLVEFALYYRFYKSTGEPMFPLFTSHMAFGVLKYTELRRQQESVGRTD